MARSGDWLTPRLDGAPWFEKPPLLYWMTALGHIARLPDEWAARLAIALTSLAFLVFFFETLEREFSPSVAMTATGILATSAGWLAFSFVSVTDLPMAIALGAATLIAVFDTRPKRGWSVGVLLGLAILAKGFVPVVLFAPVFLIARGKRLPMVAASVLVAAPWYILCYVRNGAVFWEEFFWKHHVSRFLEPTLEHVEPFWFYGPVLLAGLFPWAPLIALLARPRVYEDIRIRFLMFFIAFGLVFFSVSKNKLPGYILPLMPALAAVLAVGLDSVRSDDEDHPRRAQAWWLGACALLLAGIPTIARILPEALLSGLSRTQPSVAVGLGLPFALAGVLVFTLAWLDRPHLAVLTTALAAAVAAGYFKVSVFPVLDRQVSARAFWREHREELPEACIANVRRDWEYQLNYYAGRKLRVCQDSGGSGPRIVVSKGRLQLEH